MKVKFKLLESIAFFDNDKNKTIYFKKNEIVEVDSNKEEEANIFNFLNNNIIFRFVEILVDKKEIKEEDNKEKDNKKNNRIKALIK